MIVNNLSGLGGGETSLANIAIGLSRDGHLVTLLNLKNGALVERLRPFIDVAVLNFKNPIKLAKWFLSSGDRFDIILCNNNSALLANLILSILQIKKTPRRIFIEHSNWSRPSKIKLVLLKLIDKILFVSKSARDLYGGNTPEHLVSGLPLARDASSSAPRTSRASTPVIAVVGRFQKIKGQIFALEAFSLHQEKYQRSCHYIFIGGLPFSNPDDESYYQEFTEALNISPHSKKISILGEKKEMAQHWGYIDLLIIPSEQESFGMVVIEAARHGVPVICSKNTLGPAEILRAAGLSSLIIDRTAASFADKIDEIVFGGTDDSYIFISNKMINASKSYENEIWLNENIYK